MLYSTTIPEKLPLFLTLLFLENIFNCIIFFGWSDWTPVISGKALRTFLCHPENCMQVSTELWHQILLSSKWWVLLWWLAWRQREVFFPLASGSPSKRLSASVPVNFKKNFEMWQAHLASSRIQREMTLQSTWIISAVVILFKTFTDGNRKIQIELWD